MEDFGVTKPLQPAPPISSKRKRIPTAEESQPQSQALELTQSWREILGTPPPIGTTKVSQLLQDRNCIREQAKIFSVRVVLRLGLPGGKAMEIVSEKGNYWKFMAAAHKGLVIIPVKKSCSNSRGIRYGHAFGTFPASV